MAAGLLLVTALAGNLLADGFTVGNLGIVQVGLSAELGGQLVADHVQMQFALAGQQRFGGFRVLFHLDGRIFFLQTGQTGEHLVFFALLGGGNGLGNAGSGEGDGGVPDGGSGVAQGIAGIGELQLGQRAQIAGVEYVHVGLLLAAHHEQAAGLFSLIGVGVVQRGSGGDGTRHNAEQAQLAHEGVGHGFINKSGEGFAVVAGAFGLIAGLGIFALCLGAVRRMQINAHHVQHLGNAHAGDGGNGHHGNDGAVSHASPETGQDFVMGQFFAFQILHHQFVIGAGGSFSDFFHGSFDGGSHAGGHGHFLQALAGAFIGLIFQHVHNALEPSALADGQQHGHDGGAELVAQLIHNLHIVGVFGVHTVNDEHAANIVFLGIIPGFFSANVQAADCAHHDTGSFNHAEGAHHFADEIKITRYVDHVDLGIFPFHGSHGRADGNVAFGFFGIKVRGGRAVFYLALTIHVARGVKHCFGQRGFTIAAVTDQGNIADVLGFVICHVGSPYKFHLILYNA